VTTPDRYWIAVWDYIKEVFNLTGANSDEILFDSFFEVKESSNERLKDLMSSYKKSILDTLRANRRLIFADPTSKLLTQWTTYADNAEGQINQDKNIQYNPWNYLNYGAEFAKLSNLNNSKIWKADKKSKTSSYSYHIDINRYVITNKAFEANTHEGSVI
jgi:hypothetical protein